MAVRFKLPVNGVAVSGGWNGETGDIVEILAAGTADLKIPARPVMRLIVLACLADKAFIRGVAAGDKVACAKRLKALAKKIITPGVLPRNADSTAAAKGGDDRALRDAKGEDRILTGFKTLPAV